VTLKVKRKNRSLRAVHQRLNGNLLEKFTDQYIAIVPVDGDLSRGSGGSGINLTSVPEPACATIVLLTAAGALGRRRR
jgi:hypothetical protein